MSKWEDERAKDALRRILERREAKIARLQSKLDRLREALLNDGYPDATSASVREEADTLLGNGAWHLAHMLERLADATEIVEETT